MLAYALLCLKYRLPSIQILEVRFPEISNKGEININLRIYFCTCSFMTAKRDGTGDDPPAAAPSVAVSSYTTNAVDDDEAVVAMPCDFTTHV